MLATAPDKVNRARLLTQGLSIIEETRMVASLDGKE